MPLDRRQFLALAASSLAASGTSRGGLTSGTDDPVDGDDKIVEVLRKIRDDAKLPGLVGAIIEPGKAARIGAIGVRKLGSPEPFTAGDLVHLGSCTKAMTATMIATLVEEKSLSWDSTLAEAFPNAKFHPEFRPVTLTQLLTHRAGLPANVSWPGPAKGMTAAKQRRGVLDRLLGDEPASKPGSKFAYSNVGYVLAAMMAESKAKASWETLMRDRLFRPLKMESAGFGAPGKPGRVSQPWGHSRSLETLVPSQVDNPPVMGPAGTVHCTMADWAKFAELHIRGARGEETAILKPASFAALQTPAAGEDYAKGWLVIPGRRWSGGMALTHNGSNTLWYAVIWLGPKANVGYLAATNYGGDGADKAVDKACGLMIGLRG